MANLKAKCTKGEWSLVKARLDRIYYAPTLMEAKTQAESFTHAYRAILPALVECLQKDLDVCLAYMSYPPNRWRHKQTTSMKGVSRRLRGG